MGLAGLAVCGATYVSFAGWPALTRLAAPALAEPPDASAASLVSLGSYHPAPGAATPFEVCYYNSAWTPPDADAHVARLQADPRYRGLANIYPERVHIEIGPFRSNSGLNDFVALAGLWTDPHATAQACPADLTRRAELWAVQLQIERFELSGTDLTAFAAARSAGVEVVQVAVPAQADALHVIDETGARLSADVNLQVR
jgi:hypothetical protein